jgi:lysophospholipase L1-like esterase
MKNNIELRPDQTILFTGDSITDAGRGMKSYKPLGFGYVHFTANYLLAKYPELNIRIINTGIGGNTIRELKNRWNKDCLSYRPDILSVLIGINDLYRAHTNQLNKSVGTEEYEITYQQLLFRLKEQNQCQLVLMEPFMFCDAAANPMFKKLDAYIDIVHRMAERFDAVLVPLQQAIDRKIKQVTSDKWSDDMVHPFMWAHAWISQRWIEATKV